jgi:hypothetical protein
MIPRSLLSGAVMLPLALAAIASIHPLAQEAGRTFQVGVTGSTPAGRGNPQTALNHPAVRPVILTIADAPLVLADAEERLKPSTYTVSELASLGLLKVVEGRVMLAFNYLSADDQRLMKARAQVYGRSLADAILKERAAIEALAKPVARTDAELRQILFFIVGCVGLDWDGLDFTAEKAYRAPPTVKGDAFAYTPWMKENAPDISRRGLYWGSHNFSAGAVTLTTFGDHHSLPRRALPDILNNQVNPFPILNSPETAAVAGRRLLVAYGGAMLQDFATVIQAVHRGQSTRSQVASSTGLPANRITALVEVLKAAELIVEDGDQLRLRMLVMTESAAPATGPILSRVRAAMEAWHATHYATVKKDLAGLTAVKQATTFEVMYTEIWHYIFGYTNLCLAEVGFMLDPYAPGWPFPGFLPVLWANVLSPSSRS